MTIRIGIGGKKKNMTRKQFLQMVFVNLVFLGIAQIKMALETGLTLHDETALDIPRIRVQPTENSETNQSTKIFFGGGGNTSTSNSTLALLYPPGMIGGYRNQVMRFVAFVYHAIEENIPQLLLPSIFFSTTFEENFLDRIFYPIPMEDVFDVDHWNTFVELPKLVRSIPDGDCWTNNPPPPNNWEDSLNATLTKYSKALVRNEQQDPRTSTPPMVLELAHRSSFVTPLTNVTLAIMTGRVMLKRPRKVGLTPSMLNCSHPRVHGGGTGGGGILWNDYIMKFANPRKKESSNATTAFLSTIMKALRPATKWREVAQQCLSSSPQNQQQQQHYDPDAPYFALHPRIEFEMMVHKCGRGMEMNLTKIFSMVDNMIDNYNQNQSSTSNQVVERVFLAVSRQGMEEARGLNKTQQHILANDNLKTLEQRTRNSTFGRQQASIVECGESWMKHWYSLQNNSVPDNYYGSLVPMVINFYIATEATVFVGVSGSSWSTDVWTTRYYQGKGEQNYQYTPNGIIPVANGGLPPTHGNC